MTVLRLVNNSNDPHSRRVEPLTQEQAADLEHITNTVLAPAQQAVKDLATAIYHRRRWDTITALRKLLAAAMQGRALANRLERSPEWQTPS